MSVRRLVSRLKGIRCQSCGKGCQAGVDAYEDVETGEIALVCYMCFARTLAESFQ